MELNKNLIDEALRQARDCYGEGGDDEIVPSYGYTNGGRVSPCFALVTDVRGFALFMVVVTDLLGEDVDLATELATNVRTGSLGSHVVFYFRDTHPVE